MTQSKLDKWLAFRRELDVLPLDAAIQKVSDYWDQTPFAPYYLDNSDPKQWPDPWTLVDENIFCDFAKALVMLYSIYFTCHRKNNTFEIKIFKCSNTGFEYNTVWINNGDFILNVERDIISKKQFPNNLILQKHYTLNDLEIDKY